jgi:thiol-disulfide isomerase/thioredoxin
MERALTTNYKMGETILKRAGYAVLLFIICIARNASAQTPKRMGPASSEEVEKAFKIVKADLNSFKAHRDYIFAKGMKNPELLTQYEVWMKKYPGNVNIPLHIGTVYHKAAMPQPGDFLLKAAALDPQNGETWYMLSADASLRGENALAIEYIKKAVSVTPASAVYAYAYLRHFEHGDPTVYKEKVFDFVKRFPSDERGTAAIYWLGIEAADLDDRIYYFEELRKLYPPQKFAWSVSGMTALTDAYLQTDPEKAFVLINDLDWEGDWEIRKQVAESFIEINELERRQNYNDAISKLNHVKLPAFNFINDFVALKKASLQDKAGRVNLAYDSLAEKFAKLPTDELYNALESYEKKMGKGMAQIAKDIETIRNGTAVPASPFDLGLYTSSGTLNLNSLRGRVILLTFWFTSCGPCKEEFPHFQTVIDSFKGDSVVYIGINVLPSQDGYVLPLMENKKYSFIPLRGSTSFALEKYGVTGQPSNFVIDQNGMIVFKDFRINGQNRRTLELMVSSLLEKGPAKQ